MQAERVTILIAHGSRREGYTQEIALLARQLCDRIGTPVSHAYLELNAPDLLDCVREWADRGATSIRVLPYFLNLGRHTAVDIPRLVHEAQVRWPKLSIKLLPHVGSHPGMLNLLAAVAVDD